MCLLKVSERMDGSTQVATFFFVRAWAYNTESNGQPSLMGFPLPASGEPAFLTRFCRETPLKMRTKGQARVVRPETVEPLAPPEGPVERRQARGEHPGARTESSHSKGPEELPGPEATEERMAGSAAGSAA